MRKRVAVVCAALVVSVFGLPGLAQEKPGVVARIGVFKPKPGMVQQFEQGRKKHFEWHRKNNDAWSWFTWETISGPQSGTYITGTFGHNWKDFDAWEKIDAADSADANANMGPYIEQEFAKYYVILSDASRPPAGKDPSAMAQVTHFYVKVSGVEAFIAAIKEAKTALDKVNWPVHSFWYQLASGGEGPELVLVTARSSWADIQPSERTLAQALAEVYGPEKASALLDTVRKNTDHTFSELLRYRPDLSYVPAAK
ncbi:MAG: hypothetical protein ACHQQS_05800 [Thermoanaerobaculales bacterium]